MCLHCLAGFHDECENPKQSGGIWSCCCSPEVELVSEVRGPIKEDKDVTDIESTGRKRAALAYPIADGATCEWAGLRYAGGGVVSIIGCNGNPASDRHHGPDKSTLNNSAGNVHRICSTCHNRWHTCNDKYYGDRPKDGSAYIPTQGSYKEHDSSTRADLKEILDNEIQWRTTRRKSGESSAGHETSDTSTEQETEDSKIFEEEGKEVL